MGLMDKILGRDSDWYLARSKKQADDGDLGEAMRCAQRALEMADEMSKGNANKQIASLKRKIYDQALEQIKNYMRAGQEDAAQNAVERALRHAQNPEEKAAVNKVVDDAQLLDPTKEFEDLPIEGEEAVASMGLEDKWALYVTGLSFGRAQHFDSLGDEFKQAWIALQEGKFDVAIEGLEKIYKVHPQDVDVILELGRAYYGKDDAKRASQLLEKADKLADVIEVKTLRAQVLWSLGRFDVAEGVLQAAHDMEPENLSVLASIAQHGLFSKDYESGIEALEVLMEAVPNDLSVLRLGARLYLEAGNEDKALECFEAVNKLHWSIDPQTQKRIFDKNTAAAAAAIYMKRGEHRERTAVLLEALRESTEGEEHMTIVMQLADLYEKMQKPGKRNDALDEAIRYIDAKLKNAKGEARANLCIQAGEIADLRGLNEKSQEMFGQALSIVKEESDSGNPLAAVFVDAIERRMKGEPLPSPDELLELQKSALEAHAKKTGAAKGNVSTISEPATSSGDILYSMSPNASVASSSEFYSVSKTNVATTQD